MDRFDPIIEPLRVFLAQIGDFLPRLALAELEKVLYELRYEIANRPDWIDIPFRGLTQIAEQAEGA